MRTSIAAIVIIILFMMTSVAFADDTYVTLWQHKMRPVVGDGGFGANFASSRLSPVFTEPQYSFNAITASRPVTFLQSEYYTNVFVKRPDMQIVESSPSYINVYAKQPDLQFESNPTYVNIQVRQPELNMRSAPMAVYFATNFRPNFYGVQMPSISVPLRELPTAEIGSCNCNRIRDLNTDFPCDTGCSKCNEYLPLQ
jgi:hypothetical protein